MYTETFHNAVCLYIVHSVMLFCLCLCKKWWEFPQSIVLEHISACLHSIGYCLVIDGKSIWKLFLWLAEVHSERQKNYWLSYLWGIFPFHPPIVEMFHRDQEYMCFQRGNAMRKWIAETNSCSCISNSWNVPHSSSFPTTAIFHRGNVALERFKYDSP